MFWGVVEGDRGRGVYREEWRGSALDTCIDEKTELRILEYRRDVLYSTHSHSFPIQCYLDFAFSLSSEGCMMMNFLFDELCPGA